MSESLYNLVENYFRIGGRITAGNSVHLFRAFIISLRARGYLVMHS